MVSSITRLAPICLMACSRRTNRPFEIVFARFLDLAAIDVDVVDDELLLRHQQIEVVAERAHVLREFRGVFLEGHEHARLRELLRAVHEKADAQQCLAGPGPPDTSVGRPCGRPPLVMSSSPGIPVGAF